MPPGPWRTALETEVLCSLNKSHLFSLVSRWFLDAAHFLFAFTFEVHIFQPPSTQMFPCLQVQMLQNPHSCRHFSYAIWILKHHCATVISFILNKKYCCLNKVGGFPKVHALEAWSQCHDTEVLRLLGENQMMGIPCSQVTNIVFRRPRSFLRQKIVCERKGFILSQALSSSPTTHCSVHSHPLSSQIQSCRLTSTMLIYSQRTPAHIMTVGHPSHQNHEQNKLLYILLSVMNIVATQKHWRYPL